MKQKLILFLISIATLATAFSQNDETAETDDSGDRLVAQPTAFTYDEAGNRISRTIVSQILRDSLPDVIVWNVGELGGKTVMLSPRPSQGELTVDIIGYEQTDDCSIGIYDTNGHILTSRSINASSTEIEYNRVQNQTDIIHLKLNGESAAWMITDSNN